MTCSNALAAADQDGCGGEGEGGKTFWRNCINLRRWPQSNPKGIVSSSPRLRGTSYLGPASTNGNQPQRGCDQNRSFGVATNLPQPRWGCSRFLTFTQGRRGRANLGLWAAAPLGLARAFRTRTKNSVPSPTFAPKFQRTSLAFSQAVCIAMQTKLIPVSPLNGWQRRKLIQMAAIPLGLFAPERDSISSRRHALAPSGNPNGIPSQSPGLRGTSYPGSSSTKHPQPQRGCGPSHSHRRA